MTKTGKVHNTSKFASKKELIAKDMFYNHIVPLAQESFEHDKELAPMVFIFLDDGTEDKVAVTPMPAGMFMESTDKKELLSKLLKEFTNVVEVLAIGMFSEAWGWQARTDTEEVSEKQEIVFYSLESENMILMQRDFIIRKEGHSPRLEHGKVEEANKSVGRFTGFLKDMKKIKLN